MLVVCGHVVFGRIERIVVSWDRKLTTGEPEMGMMMIEVGMDESNEDGSVRTRSVVANEAGMPATRAAGEMQH